MNDRESMAHEADPLPEQQVLKELQEEVARLPEADRLRVETAARVLRRFVSEQGPWGQLALGLVGAEIAAGSR